VRLRTNRAKGSFSENAVIPMAFKLGHYARKGWISLHPPEHLAQAINGAKFVDGIEKKRITA